VYRPDLEVAGSYVNDELRKFFQLAGPSDVLLDNKVSLTANLDPERQLPYGPWRRAAGGFVDTTVGASAIGFGIQNPVGSGVIAICESIIFTCAVITAWTYSRNTIPQALTAPFGSKLIVIDDGDSASVRTPLNKIRNNAVIGGQVLGSEGTLAQQPNAYRFEEMILYPGQELGVSGTPGVTAGVNWSVRCRFVAPVP
jgi:hypothetical protein